MKMKPLLKKSIILTVYLLLSIDSHAQNSSSDAVMSGDIYDLVFYGFADNYDEVAKALPKDLKPVTVKGRPVVSIGFLNYVDSSVGPYKETVIQFLVDNVSVDYQELTSLLGPSALTPDKAYKGRGYFMHKLIIGGENSTAKYLAVEGGLRAGFPKSYGAIKWSPASGSHPLQVHANDGAIGIAGTDRIGGERTLLQVWGGLLRTVVPLAKEFQDAFFPREFDTKIYTQLGGVTLTMDTRKEYVGFPNVSKVQKADVVPTTEEAKRLFIQLGLSFEDGLRITGRNSMSLNISSIPEKAIELLKKEGFRSPEESFRIGMETKIFPPIKINNLRCSSFFN